MTPPVHLNASNALVAERPDLFIAAADGVRDVLRVQGSDAHLTTGGQVTGDVLDAFESYAYDDRRRQLNVSQYARNLYQHGDVGRSSQDFILTGLDTYADGTNYVFGTTIYDWQLSIQSVARFVRATNDTSLQRQLVTHVARHEYAHLAGMNQASDYVYPDTRPGPYDGHCADLCTLQQVMSVPEAITQVRALEGHEMAGFCVSCARQLRARTRIASV